MVTASSDATSRPSEPRLSDAAPATVIVDVLTDANLPRRLAAYERLIRAIEDELSDESIDDEQRLQNVGERVADFTDGL